MNFTISQTSITMSFCLMLFIFNACVKKDEIIQEFQIKPNRVEIYAYEELQFKANKEVVKWTSSNEFICQVNDNGLLKTRHIGKAVIQAKFQDELINIDIHVTPRITHIPEPITLMDLSLSEILNIEKRQLISQSLVQLIYKTDSKLVDHFYYLFFNNKLKYAIVDYKSLTRTQYDELLFFYDERYEYLGKNKRDHYFTDVKKNILIAVSINDKPNVRYTKYQELE